MADIDFIIRQGENLMDDSEARLLRIVKDVEGKLYAELAQIMNTLTVTDGKISNNKKVQDFLGTLDGRLRRALVRSGYGDAVKEFVRSFDAINENVRELHAEVNAINITSEQIAGASRVEIAATLDRLTGAGLAKDFINPVRQSLYRNVMFGATVADAEKSIRSFVISSANGESRLMRYVKQAARDSVSQYDGSIQQQVAVELNLNAVRYVGSLIRDSRAQCRKWVGMGIITYEQLAEEIPWALRKGTFDGKQAGGMYPDTTVDTFAIYRGGYNCRHRAIPTFRKPA